MTLDALDPSSASCLLAWMLGVSSKKQRQLAYCRVPSFSARQQQVGDPPGPSQAERRSTVCDLARTTATATTTTTQTGNSGKPCVLCCLSSALDGER